MIQKTVKEIVDRHLATVLAPNVAKTIATNMSTEVTDAVTNALLTTLIGKQQPKAPADKKKSTGTADKPKSRSQTPGARLKMRMKKRLQHTRKRQTDNKPPKPGDDIVLARADEITNGTVAVLKEIEKQLKAAEKAAKDDKKKKKGTTTAGNGAQPAATNVTPIPGLSPDAPL